MENEHPLYIESLSKDIEEALRLKKKAEADVKHYDNLWYQLYRERQAKCPHVYPSGKSAWRHNYAYSNCEICGYSDM